MNLFILILLISSVSLASSTRTIDADSIRSSDSTKIFSLPSASTNLVGDNTTNTLTNKSLSGSSNTFTNIPAGSALTGQVPVANGGTGGSSFTLGSILFSDGTNLTQDNANLFWDSTNYRIGIGTTIPAFKLHTKSSTSPSVGVERVDSSATSGSYVLRKARGTIGSESALSLNDSIGSVSFFGYGATTYSASPSALISASAQEAFTDTAKGTRFVLSTTANGSTTLVSSLAIQDSTLAVGRGFSHAAPVNWILRGTDVVGGTTDTASGHVIIRSGLSTGSAAGGNITFQISPAGTSGSSQNTALSRFAIYPEGIIKHYSPDGTKYLDLSVSDSATNHAYVFPLTQGASNTFLKNDGSGNLSWDSLTPAYEQEVPSGAIDGSNVTFTLTYTPNPTNSLQVYLDGSLQIRGGGEDYTQSGTTLTFNTAPATGQKLIVVYTR